MLAHNTSAAAKCTKDVALLFATMKPKKSLPECQEKMGYKCAELFQFLAQA